MSTKTILFGERAAGVYLLTEIYDPDVDGANVSASGKIVPAVGSLVVDNTKGLHNQQYTVVAVDQTTYKAYMEPSTFVVDSTAQVDRVLSYGNDIFMLYYSSATIASGGVNINLTRLIVDNKLSLFGNHAATYQLIKEDSDGNEVIISRWYDPKGVAKGTVIPMLETGVEGIRKCDGCYTDETLNEGDIVTCRIYSAAGIMIAQINLVAKPAHFLNELVSTANPIVAMDVTANQIFNDGVFYLYQNQNIEELAIFVHLIYSDGTIRDVAIDNRAGFIYGLEEVQTHTVGLENDITIKYYLSDKDVADESAFVYYLTSDTTFQDGTIYYTRSALGNTWQYTEAEVVVGDTIPHPNNTYYTRNKVTQTDGIDGRIRFISSKRIVRVISKPQDIISKISIIPHWNSNSNSWNLNCLKYRTSQTSEPIDDGSVIIEGFVGDNYDNTQDITLRTTETLNGISVEYTQNVGIKLFDKTNPLTGIVNWLIGDHAGSQIVYGSNTVPAIRPRIYFNGVSYNIPANLFTANSLQTGVEVFLDNFYYNAAPPVYDGALKVPTHFIVKDKTGRSLMTSPISVDNFTTNLNLDTPSGNEGIFVGETLVVEFMCDNHVLYGVPVDCINTPTSMNANI